MPRALIASICGRHQPHHVGGVGLGIARLVRASGDRRRRARAAGSCRVRRPAWGRAWCAAVSSWVSSTMEFSRASPLVPLSLGHRTALADVASDAGCDSLALACRTRGSGSAGSEAGNLDGARRAILGRAIEHRATRTSRTGFEPLLQLHIALGAVALDAPLELGAGRDVDRAGIGDQQVGAAEAAIEGQMPGLLRRVPLPLGLSSRSELDLRRFGSSLNPRAPQG